MKNRLDQDSGFSFSVRWKELLTISVISLVISLFYSTGVLIKGLSNVVISRDAVKYLFMSTHPGEYHIAPFCWRVGGPMLFGATGMDPQMGAFIVSVTAVTITGVIIYRIGRNLHLSHNISLLGMLLGFTLGWGTKAEIVNIGLIDALTILIVALGFLFIQKNRILPLVLITFLGAFIKESTLFLAVLYYTWHARQVLDLKTGIKSILIFLPSIAVVVTLRVLIPAWNLDQSYLNTLSPALRAVHLGTAHYRPLHIIGMVIHTRISRLNVHTLPTYALSPFGIAGLVAPFLGLKSTGRALLRLAPFIVLFYLQLLFAVNTERLLVQAYPVLVPFAASGLAGFSRRIGSSLVPWYIFAILCIIMLGVVNRAMFVPFEYQSILFFVTLILALHVGIFRVKKAE